MTKAEKMYLNSVQSLGCIVCRNNGDWDTPAEIHHIRKGQGVAMRASHYETIPLCPHHHRNGGHGEAIHAGQKTWEARFGTEEALLQQVTDLLTLEQAG